MDFHGNSRNCFCRRRFRGDGLHGWSFHGGSGGGLFPAAADGNDEGYHRHCRRDAGDQPFGKRTAGGGLQRLEVPGFRPDRLGFRDVPDGRRFSCRVGDDLKQRVHILGALLGQDAHAEGQNVKLLLRQPRTAGQGVLYHAVGGRGGQDAGTAIVDRGGHGVNVRPGADLPVPAVLLHGAEPVLGHHLGGLHIAVLSLNVQILCRAQVQKDKLAVTLHHDVIRADVPVNDAVLMDFRQRLHDGRHQADAGAVIHGASPLQFFQQCFALDEVHDDVGGLILDENGLDPDDTGNTAQLCHFPGFLQEAVEALFHAGFLHDGAAPHNGGAVFPADHAGAHGVVFLDGDLLFQQ